MTDDLFARADAYFRSLQDRIVETLEALDDTATFVRDDWDRDGADDDGPVLGGEGRTRVLEGGALFEKAGVNFSSVHGRFSEDFAARFPGDGLDFRACGVSLVLHPRNPHVPTVHMNYRRLSRGATGWFGGGADLTPWYLYDEDARHFHTVYRDVCAAHDVVDHATLKRDCDDYFRVHHRGEGRGIGGLFFDHLREPAEPLFDFVRDAGDAFLPSYVPIVEQRREQAWTEAERDWQLVRRGRYVEFNLVHDRGTTFGLRTGGRVESILMSLPNLVSWRYDHHPEPGSREARLVEVLRTPRDWVGTPTGESA